MGFISIIYGFRIRMIYISKILNKEAKGCLETILNQQIKNSKSQAGRVWKKKKTVTGKRVLLGFGNECSFSIMVRVLLASLSQANGTRTYAMDIQDPSSKKTRRLDWESGRKRQGPLHLKWNKESSFHGLD